MTSTSTHSGAVLTTKTDDSGTHNVTQEEAIPLTSSDPEHVNINWGLGPVKVTGYVNFDNFNIVILPTICGIKLGDQFSGHLQDGMMIKFDIEAARGALRYYLKNGNELWTNLDIKITFDGTFQGDYKIISF